MLLLKPIHQKNFRHWTIKSLPDIGTKLPSCWRHPPSRVVHIFTHFPTRHVFHDSGLFLEILLPFFDKSGRNRSKKEEKQNKCYVLVGKETDLNNQDQSQDTTENTSPFILFGLKQWQYCPSSSIFFFLERPVQQKKPSTSTLHILLI